VPTFFLFGGGLGWDCDEDGRLVGLAGLGLFEEGI
jgi:hypothetical protein